MVLKEPCMSLTLTIVLVLLLQIGVSELEINARASPCAVFAVWSKMAEICRGFDLSDCQWLDIH